MDEETREAYQVRIQELEWKLAEAELKAEEQKYRRNSDISEESGRRGSPDLGSCKACEELWGTLAQIQEQRDNAESTAWRLTNELQLLKDEIHTENSGQDKGSSAELQALLGAQKEANEALIAENLKLLEEVHCQEKKSSSLEQQLVDQEKEILRLSQQLQSQEPDGELILQQDVPTQKCSSQGGNASQASTRPLPPRVPQNSVEENYTDQNGSHDASKLRQENAELHRELTQLRESVKNAAIDKSIAKMEKDEAMRRVVVAESRISSAPPTPLAIQDQQVGVLEDAVLGLQQENQRLIAGMRLFQQKFHKILLGEPLHIDSKLPQIEDGHEAIARSGSNDSSLPGQGVMGTYLNTNPTNKPQSESADGERYLLEIHTLVQLLDAREGTIRQMETTISDLRVQLEKLSTEHAIYKELMQAADEKAEDLKRQLDESFHSHIRSPMLVAWREDLSSRSPSFKGAGANGEHESSFYSPTSPYKRAYEMGLDKEREDLRQKVQALSETQKRLDMEHDGISTGTDSDPR